MTLQLTGTCRNVKLKTDERSKFIWNNWWNHSLLRCWEFPLHTAFPDEERHGRTSAAASRTPMTCHCFLWAAQSHGLRCGKRFQTTVNSCTFNIGEYTHIQRLKNSTKTVIITHNSFEWVYNIRFTAFKPTIENVLLNLQTNRSYNCILFVYALQQCVHRQILWVCSSFQNLHLEFTWSISWQRNRYGAISRKNIFNYIGNYETRVCNAIFLHFKIRHSSRTIDWLVLNGMSTYNSQFVPTARKGNRLSG